MRAPKFQGLVLCAILLVASLPAAGQGKTDAQPWLLAASGHLGSFSTSDLENSGRQAFSYLQIAYDSKAWGLTITSKGSDTRYETEHSPNPFDITTLTDTTVATHFSFKSRGFSVRVGVDATLPMGKSSYTNEELTQIIVDPIGDDLMIADVYGAGVNIIPHALVAYQTSEKMTVGIGAKYELTGGYDPTEEIANDELDPGDRLLIIGNLAYDISARRHLLLSLAWGTASKDTINGEDLFRGGDTISGEIRYIHGWNPAFNSIVSLSFYSQGANEEVGEGNTLISELNNANSDRVEVYINNIYRYSNRFSLLLLAGIKNVWANEYEEDDYFYDAGRSKYFAEPGLIWYVNNNMYVTVKGRASFVEDKKDAFATADASYQVYNIDGGVVFSF